MNVDGRNGGLEATSEFECRMAKVMESMDRPARKGKKQTRGMACSIVPAWESGEEEGRRRCLS